MSVGGFSGGFRIRVYDDRLDVMLTKEQKR